MAGYQEFCTPAHAADGTIEAISTTMDARSMIESSKWLYLLEISEPEQNALRLLIGVGEEGEVLTESDLEKQPATLRGLLQGARPINMGPGCKVFEVYWDSYIGYSIRNESYALPESSEPSGGDLGFRQYSESKYLDFIAASTFADQDFPGPFKHWAVYCSDHTIDVVSMDIPKVRVSTDGSREFE